MNAVLQRVPVWAPPARAQGARVQLQHLGKTFGERRVLDALNFTLEPGEFVAIVGRSGCGKSTLLRLLAGLDTPSQGQVLVDGASLQADAAAGQGVRLMFQESRLLPWQRVADNVALGLPRTPDTTARVLDALQAVGLADRAHEWPARLSGGQRQRVALARALVHQPRLLLLDEPLGALDALTRVEMHALLSRLWRAHGCTAVLVTHDVAEAVTLADRVLLIEEGAIALDVPVPLGHPRERGSAALAALEERVLQRVLHRPPRVERATRGCVAGV